MRIMARILVFVLMLLAAELSAQDNTVYKGLIGSADSLYTAKDFLNSAKKYSRAFGSNKWKGGVDDYYNAACSWALAGNPDSAFLLLGKAATAMTNLKHLSTDRDLTSLHTDKRWAPLLAQVKLNKEKAEANMNMPLKRELDSIFEEDQRERRRIDSIQKKFGMQSQEMKDHWKVIMRKDSFNLRRVTQILDQYGWLGRDVIGGQANMTLFLVIQHADQKTQEKYLPMMQEAAKQGRAEPRNLALLEDRVALAQGKKQIYGSQIHYDNATGKYFVAPIEDEVNVNKRRAAVGLEPLEQYVKRWGIDYKLPKN